MVPYLAILCKAIKKGLLLRILLKKSLIFIISTQIFLKIRGGLTPPSKIQGGLRPPNPPYFGAPACSQHMWSGTTHRTSPTPPLVVSDHFEGLELKRTISTFLK